MIPEKTSELPFVLTFSYLNIQKVTREVHLEIILFSILVKHVCPREEITNE
jgi:hypothetical protein